MNVLLIYLPNKIETTRKTKDETGTELMKTGFSVFCALTNFKILGCSINLNIYFQK